jgi:hypothetical protein
MYEEGRAKELAEWMLRISSLSIVLSSQRLCGFGRWWPDSMPHAFQDAARDAVRR